MVAPSCDVKKKNHEGEGIAVKEIATWKDRRKNRQEQTSSIDPDIISYAELTSSTHLTYF
jgi:hypothetical protein